MPKKFTGENSKAAAARDLKKAAKATEQAKIAKEKEDALWVDDDKHANRKIQRKEDQEKKRLEQLEKKEQNRKLYEQEAQAAEKVKPAATKVTQAQIHRTLKLEAERKELEAKEEEDRKKNIVKNDDLHENLNKTDVGEVARTVDEALKVLDVKGTPEKSLKTAYTEFENKRLPQLKIEKPTLRLSQLKQLLKKEWQKSPDNPLNEKIMNVINK